MTHPLLVLASASPRRREILDRLALRYTIEPADIDETPLPGEEADAYVRRLATGKARAAARPGAVVIGADTAVVLDGEILGKPADRADATATLRRLAGRTHQVVTGVAVLASTADDETHGADATAWTTVRFTDLTDERIDWYVATGEADDKAGSYALQEAAGLFADDVDGSVTNVIGLPLPLLDRLCTELGIDLLSFRDGASDATGGSAS